MNKDFYSSELDRATLEHREEFIAHRWAELYKISNKAADETKKFLFIVNAGGAVAMLSFIGANGDARISAGTKWALVLFCCGLVAVGILHIRITHRVYGLFNAWRKNSAKYWKQEIGYTQLTTEDEKRTDSDFLEFFIGYVSAFFFLAGLIIGGITLIK